MAPTGATPPARTQRRAAGVGVAAVDKTLQRSIGKLTRSETRPIGNRKAATASAQQQFKL